MDCLQQRLPKRCGGTMTWKSALHQDYLLTMSGWDLPACLIMWTLNWRPSSEVPRTHCMWHPSKMTNKVEVSPGRVKSHWSTPPTSSSTTQKQTWCSAGKKALLTFSLNCCKGLWKHYDMCSVHFFRTFNLQFNWTQFVYRKKRHGWNAGWTHVNGLQIHNSTDLFMTFHFVCHSCCLTDEILDSWNSILWSLPQMIIELDNSIWCCIWYHACVQHCVCAQYCTQQKLMHHFLKTISKNKWFFVSHCYMELKSSWLFLVFLYIL